LPTQPSQHSAAEEAPPGVGGDVHGDVVPELLHLQAELGAVPSVEEEEPARKQ